MTQDIENWTEPVPPGKNPSVRSSGFPLQGAMVEPLDIFLAQVVATLETESAKSAQNYERTRQ